VEWGILTPVAKKTNATTSGAYGKFGLDKAKVVPLKVKTAEDAAKEKEKIQARKKKTEGKKK